jgi:hypothetical protein
MSRPTSRRLLEKCFLNITREILILFCVLRTFPLVDLSQVSIESKQTPLLIKYQQSKTFKKYLSRNYVKFYEEAMVWRKPNLKE